MFLWESIEKSQDLVSWRTCLPIWWLLQLPLDNDKYVMLDTLLFYTFEKVRIHYRCRNQCHWCKECQNQGPCSWLQPVENDVQSDKYLCKFIIKWLLTLMIEFRGMLLISWIFAERRNVPFSLKTRTFSTKKWTFSLGPHCLLLVKISLAATKLLEQLDDAIKFSTSKRILKRSWFIFPSCIVQLICLRPV